MKRRPKYIESSTSPTVFSYSLSSSHSLSYTWRTTDSERAVNGITAGLKQAMHVSLAFRLHKLPSSVFLVPAAKSLFFSPHPPVRRPGKPCKKRASVYHATTESARRDATRDTTIYAHSRAHAREYAPANNNFEPKVRYVGLHVQRAIIYVT